MIRHGSNMAATSEGRCEQLGRAFLDKCSWPMPYQSIVTAVLALCVLLQVAQNVQKPSIYVNHKSQRSYRLLSIIFRGVFLSSDWHYRDALSSGGRQERGARTMVVMVVCSCLGKDHREGRDAP